MTAASHGSGPSFDRIHAAITAVTGTAERRGPGYINVCCPAHDDHTPSLTLRYDPTREKTTVHCQTGVCTDTEILAAVGLSVRDLFDTPERPHSSQRSSNGVVDLQEQKQAAKAGSSKADGTTRKSFSGKPKLHYEWQCSYIYCNREGEPRGKVNRFLLYDSDGSPHLNKRGEHKKSFSQKRFDTSTRRWKSGQFEPLLYHFDQVVQAINTGETVLLNEGEKDADAAHTAWDICATTSAAGAGKFRPEHAEQLRGAHVVMVVDRDLAGYTHAISVKEHGAEVFASLRFVTAASGKDTSDHIEAGYGFADLVEVDPEAELAALQKTTPPQTQPSDQAESSDDEDTPKEPAYPVPMSRGLWAFSLGDGSDPFPRGLFQLVNSGWQYIAPLPYVLERLIRRDGAGRPAGRFYRLAMRPIAEDVVIIADDDMKTGLWAEHLDVTLSADAKIIQAAATAIRAIAREAPRQELSPRWLGGELETPPSDVGPAGYGMLAPDEARARQVWRQIAEIAERNPKVAFVLGASLAAPFVSALSAQSFVCSMSGKAVGGKTITLNAAASIWGDPGQDGIVKVLNTSGIGLVQQLGTMGCLPAFFDEVQSSEVFQTPSKVQQMIFSVTQGAKRTVGGQTGTPRTSPGWQGILFLTGNVSITGMLTNEGAIRRTIEIIPPITRTAEDAKELEYITPDAHGWPSYWQRQRGFDVDGFDQLVTESLDDLQIPDGGIAEALGRSLALAVAGARRLEEVVGARGFHQAAFDAARDLLNVQLDELEEQGATPGARAVSALLSAWVSRPAQYPTRAGYKQATLGDEHGTLPGARLTRDVEGWDLSQEAGEAADLALLKDRFGPICEAAQIDAPRIALRELADVGVLVRSQEKDQRLRSFLRVGSRSQRTEVYRFRFDEDLLSQLNLPGTLPQPPSSSSTTCENIHETRPESSSSNTQASPVVPGSKEQTGDNANGAVNCTDTSANDRRLATVPGVPGSDPNSRENEEERAVILVGRTGPVRLAEHGRCRVCQETAPSRDQYGPVHAMCAQQPTNSEAKAAGPAEGVCPSCGERSTCWDKDTSTWLHSNCSTPTGDDSQLELTELPGVDLNGRPVPPQPEPYAAACMVVDRTGVYLPDGQRFRVSQTLSDSADLLTLARTLNLGHPGGPGQIILTDSVIRMLGLEIAADDGVVGQDARDQIAQRLVELDTTFHQRAREDGWQIPELGPEHRARANDGRVFDFVLAPYLHIWSKGRMDAHPMGMLDRQMDDASATDEEFAAESARVMGHLAYLLGQPWRVSGVQAGWDLYDRASKRRSRRRNGHQLTVPAKLPDLTGPPQTSRLDALAPPIKWHRTPAARELDARWIVHLDRIMAWPAAAREVMLGYCTPEHPEMIHHVGADAVAALLADTTAIPAGLYRVWLPQQSNALPPLHGLQGKEPRMLWVPADTVRAAICEDDASARWVGAGIAVSDLLNPPDGIEPEAWTFPEQGRLLSGVWADTIRDARYVTKTTDPLADEMIKRAYGGMLQSTEAALSQTRASTQRTRTHCQQTWRASLVAHNYAWQQHLVRKRMLSTGHAPIAVDIDEICYLTDDYEGMSIGSMEGRIGQYARKRVRELTDAHRDQLAQGLNPFHLSGGLKGDE